MEVKVQDVMVAADLLHHSAGLALDIGCSVAKIVFRCNKQYERGKAKDKSKSSNCLKTVNFPREAVDQYLQFILDHADLTGHDLHTTGLGSAEYRKVIEDKLKVKITNHSEFLVFSNALMRIINEAALTSPYCEVDSPGLEEGKAGFYTAMTFQYIADGRPIPDKDMFEDEVDKGFKRLEEMRNADVRVPCLVGMCGSAFPLMILREDGKFDCREISLMGGKSFLGLAAILTGQRDWSSIQHLIETHDGNTAYTFQGGPPTPAAGGSQGGSEQPEDQRKKDPYGNVDNSLKMFPFGNGNVDPRDKIKDGDLLYAWFESLSVNLAILAYNTALANGIHQVLFCGGFTDVPLAQKVITHTITQRNLFAFHKKDYDNLVDFWFIRHGQHLGALGALLASVEH